MADCMEWELIEDCPKMIDVLFLFEGDHGALGKDAGRFAAIGRATNIISRQYYYIGFEMNGTTVDVRVPDDSPPIAFARITTPGFISGEAA